MPELPDIVAYMSGLEPRIIGQALERVRLTSAFVLRTAQPPVADLEGRIVRQLRRVGKRICIGLEGDLWFVIHLMIAGRLHWRPPHAKLAGRQNLASLDFPSGSLTLTEAGRRHRASIHILSGEEACCQSIPEVSTSSKRISTPSVRHLHPRSFSGKSHGFPGRNGRTWALR